MAARSVCPSSSLLNPLLTLPRVAAPSSSSSSSSSSTLGYGSCCYAGRRFPLHVATASQASDGRKAIILDNKVFEDKTMDDLNPLCKQSAQLKTPAAAHVSAVATEVKTEPLEKLKTGFLTFKEKYQKDPALVKKLAEGQQPPYMIIACADSRVDPCTVLNLGPGEAFVLRNIGNMVPPYSSLSCSSTSSAIEYAVLHLKVKHLVVIGHSRCGAIKALMGIKEDGSNRFSEFIEDWVLVSKGASQKVKNVHQGTAFEDQCTHCEKEAVTHSLWNCLSFPFVREKMASGELTLHGGYYDFVNGAFEHWSLDASSLKDVVKVQ
eukprot:c22661_g1_i1 orf=558-1520(-)